jgi:hypothetical protein
MSDEPQASEHQWRIRTTMPLHTLALVTILFNAAATAAFCDGSSCLGPDAAAAGGTAVLSCSAASSAASEASRALPGSCTNAWRLLSTRGSDCADTMPAWMVAARRLWSRAAEAVATPAVAPASVASSADEVQWIHTQAMYLVALQLLLSWKLLCGAGPGPRAVRAGSNRNAASCSS